MYVFLSLVLSSYASHHFHEKGQEINEKNWVFHDTRFCQIIWQISTQGRENKNVKNCPSGVGTHDLLITTLTLYQLSWAGIFLAGDF